MADPHSVEDAAALYVLGQLGTAERRKFEACLARSSELRSLVRELEAGTVALARAMPQLEPPAQLWPRIEKAVAEETHRKTATSSFWPGWMRSGWAAAAACVIGCLLYEVRVNRPSAPGKSRLALSQDRSSVDATATESARAEMARASAQPSGATLPVPAVSRGGSPAWTSDQSVLRRQIAELQSQVTQLSRMLTQQQTLSPGSSQLVFFHLIAPKSEPATGRATTALSPELQRALVVALARELGWFRRADDEPRQKSQSADSEAKPTSQLGVDFADFAPASTETATPPPLPTEAESDAADTSRAASTTLASSNAIPGFVSGTNAVLAIDASVAPSGSYVTVWSGTAGSALQPRGSLVLGTNPAVVTIPFANWSTEGWNITVTASGQSGQAYVIGQATIIGPLPQPVPSGH